MILISKELLVKEIKEHAERLDNKTMTSTNEAYQLAHKHIIDLVELLAKYDGVVIPDP
jgi:hypothetical protein